MTNKFYFAVFVLINIILFSSRTSYYSSYLSLPVPNIRYLVIQESNYVSYSKSQYTPSFFLPQETSIFHRLIYFYAIVSKIPSVLISYRSPFFFLVKSLHRDCNEVDDYHKQIQRHKTTYLSNLIIHKEYY